MGFCVRSPVGIRIAAHFVLGAMTAGGLLVIGYALGTYRAEPAWATGVLVIGITVLAVALVAMGSSENCRVNVALTAISVSVPLYATNAFLAVFSEPPQGRSAAAMADPAFDRRTVKQVVADLRAQGIAAYPRAPIQFLLRHPEAIEGLLPVGGISRVTTALCNESGQYVTYKADRYGFNNDDAAYEAKEGITSLVVGDSFAQGICVPQEENTAGLLRARGINAVTVGNLGNGPLLELASLVEYGRKWQPSTVFWLYYPNDLEDLAQERMDPFLRRYLKGESQGLIERQDQIDSHLKRIFDAEYFSRGEDEELKIIQSGIELMRSPMVRLKDLATLYYLRRLLNMDREAWLAQTNEILPLFEQVLHVADSEVRGWGGRMYFVYLADWQTFAWRPVPSRNPVLQAAKQNGIAVIDFEEMMASTPDPLHYFPYRAPNHYTNDGFGFLVDHLTQYLNAPTRPSN